ncbi:MAG: TIGR00730 family Rossman fold protein [Bacteroidales bacterium]|nr:TIGR00730 family Rossman fold protein [Bacteroidales bacterium]
MNDSQDKIIRKCFSPKFWNDLRTAESWAVFKIMAEFVNSYEKLGQIGPCVAIFGSARTKSEDPYYRQTVELAERLTAIGFGIITGGGPGIMEAANKGAAIGGGSSVGLNINLPFEQDSNPYIDRDKLINFNYFFVRKTIFMQFSQGYIVMPGGFGTLDELTEALTLIQTNKLVKFPIVLYGRDYWQGLLDWVKGTMLTRNMISPEDLDLFHVVDSVDEAANVIEEFYDKYAIKPNF